MTLDHPAVATHVTWLKAEPPCCKLSHCEATVLKRNELVFIQSHGESAGRQDDVQGVNTISMTMYIMLHGRQHFWSHQRQLKRSSDKGGSSKPSTSLNTTWQYNTSHDWVEAPTHLITEIPWQFQILPVHNTHCHNCTDTSECTQGWWKLQPIPLFGPLVQHHLYLKGRGWKHFLGGFPPPFSCPPGQVHNCACASPCAHGQGEKGDVCVCFSAAELGRSYGLLWTPEGWLQVQ